jgi:integrase
MPSLRKFKGCKNYTACFTDATGKRKQVSTHTANRKDALRIAAEYEAATKGQRIAAKIQTSLSEIVRTVTGEFLPDATAREFMARFIEGKRNRINPSTVRKYETAFKSFLAALGDKADTPIRAITQGDVYAWQSSELGRVRPSTAKLHTRLIREAFKQAIAGQYREADPFAGLEPIKAGKAIRKGFTIQQIQDLLKAAPSEEWRSMIIFGVYSGQRLGDLAALTWRNLDPVEGTLTIRAKKTGNDVSIPIPPPLLRHIGTLPTPKRDRDPVHPEAALKAVDESKNLSKEFDKILVAAGIRDPETERAGNGRAGKRNRNELSFHSLRHTFVSILKSAGVGEAVAMDLAGHESAAVSASYTHIKDDVKRAAMATIPDVTGEGAR